MRLDNEDSDMPSNRDGRCRECGAYWVVGDRIYFRTGHPYYFCSKVCRDKHLGIINNTGIPKERNATESIPVQQQYKQQQEHHTITREERILAMHDQKMRLLGDIAEQLEQLVAAERVRNEYLKKGADR